MEWNRNSVKVESNALEVWCVVLGVLSLSGMLYGVFGILGLILCMVATKKGKYGTAIVWGRVLSVIGILVAIGMCFYWNGERKQSVEEAFAKGVEYGLATYNGTVDTSDLEKEAQEDVEEQVNEDTALDRSDAYLNPGEMMIDGKEFSLLCTFADLKSTFGVTSEDIQYVDDSVYVVLNGNVDVENDGGFGIVVYLDCTVEDSAEQVNEARVTYVALRNPQIPYECLGGITCGMSLQEVRDLLVGVPYVIDEYDEDGYIRLEYECLSADGSGELEVEFWFDSYAETLTTIAVQHWDDN